MLGKNTILKAIHNRYDLYKFANGVWMLGKNTILKAIHNTSAEGLSGALGVNAG